MIMMMIVIKHDTRYSPVDMCHISWY